MKNRFGLTPPYEARERGQKPQPPLHYSQRAASLMKDGLYGLSSYLDYPKPQYIQLDDYTYLYMKYETDLARWERDQAEDALQELRNNLKDDYQNKLKEQNTIVENKFSTTIYDKNNEIKALKEEIAKKKQVECFHEYDIAVDPEYWKKIKNQVQFYQDATITLGFLLFTVLCFIVWIFSAL